MMKRWNIFLALLLVVVLAMSFTGCKGSADSDPDPDPDNGVVLEEGPVVFVSWGGSWQEMIDDLVLKPFSEEYGVEFLSVSPTDYSKLKAMVESNQVEWDVVDVGGGAPVRLKDLLEPLDFDLIDTTGIPDQFIVGGNLGIGWNTFSDVLAWNTDTFGDDGPKTWADFWDVEKFPGPRSLRNTPYANIERALLADGMSKEQIYPLTDEKIDRAFAKLDEIKPHITVWWDSAAQPAQLLADGEVVMAAAWNGRLNTVIGEGAPVKYHYNEGLLHFGSAIVAKDSPNRNLAMLLINYLCKPEIQAEIGKRFGYGGTNEKSFDFIDPDVAKTLNTYPEYVKTQLIYDEGYWGDPAKRDPIDERWKSWMLQ